MAEELTFVIINPYTIRKSRTGGVIGRLLSRSSAELVAARMFAPSPELVEEYLQTITVSRAKPNWEVRNLIRDYIASNYPADENGHRRRLMFLLFRGENAIEDMMEHVVGHVSRASLSGETIRDTYGDCIKGPDGKVKYFEPAVLIIPCAAEAEPALRVWAKYAKRDGGLLKDVIPWSEEEKCEETTVLIKPDIFSIRSVRAGNIIDIFSKADLYIVGAKVLRMSVAQAEEFYGPVKETLCERLKAPVTQRMRAVLEDEFSCSIPEDIAGDIGAKLNRIVAEGQFNKIVKFMTGRDRTKLSEEEKNAPGLVRCLALVYQGVDAVKKIRAIIGTTDPGKAKAATVRKEFGRDVMVNAAHASDSPESAQREMNIIRFDEDDIEPLIAEYLGDEPHAD
jgi:nucleoside diphosphate kinase